MSGRRRTALAAGAVALLLAGCGDGGGKSITQPHVAVPGVLRVELTTPGAAEGALILEVTGPDAVTQVTGGAGYQVHHRQSATTLRLAAFGVVQSGELARFTVSDTSRASAYSARVLEAAGADNALRTDLAGYQVRVVR